MKIFILLNNQINQMITLILVLVMALGMLSCTKEKVDNSKCGNITSKLLAYPGERYETYFIVVNFPTGVETIKLNDVFLAYTYCNPTCVYVNVPKTKFDSYKIGDTYCKP